MIISTINLGCSGGIDILCCELLILDSPRRAKRIDKVFFIKKNLKGVEEIQTPLQKYQKIVCLGDVLDYL
jgi:hypothetical protein